MSELLSLETIKQHVRIDHDFDDSLLINYRDAAIAHAEQYIGARLVADAQAMTQSGDMVINAGIQAACLILIAHLYANREGSDGQARTDEMPRGYYALLMPYRSYIGVAGW